MLQCQVERASVKLRPCNNVAKRAIVYVETLRSFACCDMLDVAESSLKMVNIGECCMMLLSFGQVLATMLGHAMLTCSICNTQHVATRSNRMAKRTHYAVPSNVAIRCVETL